MKKQTKLELLKIYYRNYGLDMSLATIGKIQRAASKLQLMAEDYCNGFIGSEYHEMKSDKIVESIRKALFKDCEDAEFAIGVQNDPRGYVLSLAVRKGKVNDLIYPHRFNE